MGTSVRSEYPGKGYRSDVVAGFRRRKRLPDGSLEPLVCKCRDCGRVYRSELKRALVDLRGGACNICGYKRHLAALTFHHLEPAKKDFEIARGHTRSWDALVHEVRKCLLLCENCHREVHAGVTAIPAPIRAEIEEFTRDIPNRAIRPAGRPRATKS